MAYPTHGAEFHERQSWKTAVAAASTANVTLATGVENGDTLDGITLATGDRILLKDQTASEENGIYVVTAGAPVRAADMDAENEVWGAVVMVIGGTANEGTAWQCTTTGPITIDTDPIAFASFGGGGGGGGFTPVVVYADSSTPGTTSATPATVTNVPFDTVYDIDGSDLSGVLPGTLGLVYDDSGEPVFEATDDGLWTVNISATITAAPLDTGFIYFHTPVGFVYPRLDLDAAGNKPEWQASVTFAMRTGEQFYLAQFSGAGSSVPLITYAALDIIRVAGSVS